MDPEWKYKVIMEGPDWYDAQEWCEQCIGEFDVDWYKLGIDPISSWDTGITQSVWYFKKLEHANWFSIRWT